MSLGMVSGQVAASYRQKHLQTYQQMTLVYPNDEQDFTLLFGIQTFSQFSSVWDFPVEGIDVLYALRFQTLNASLHPLIHLLEESPLGNCFQALHGSFQTLIDLLKIFLCTAFGQLHFLNRSIGFLECL